MSLPPPVLPPQVVARTRIRALTADLGQELSPKLRAALAYEIGALTELRMGELEQARAHYETSVEIDPSFRPPLFALRRLLKETRDDEALVRVLAKSVNASVLASERAAALVELGCLLEDRLTDPAGAKSAFERALVADPSHLPALAMLERTLLSQNHQAEASALVAQRAAHTSDPKLRAVLAREAARDLASRQRVDAAIETLLSALALPGSHFSTLLTLAEIALRHERPAIAARACEDLGALLATRAAGQLDAADPEVAARYPDPAKAGRAAAFYYREAGRLYSQLEQHGREAVLAYERALSCARSDVLLMLEHAAACEADNDLTSARASLDPLLALADPRRAAGLQFQLAELAERLGESSEALDRLRAAYALAPDTPVIAAVLEDRLLDAGAFDQLCELQLSRAALATGDARAECLRRAALAAERGNDLERAQALYLELSESVTNRVPVLRELYGVALRAGKPAALRIAAEKLLACDIDHTERSALLRASCEAALAAHDVAGARALLQTALQDPACEAWVGHSAWVISALHADRALLARAHQKLAELAERAEDTELAAAHLAACSRALLRQGDDAGAEQCLRRALALAPTQPYAVPLLEECLLRQGEATEVVHLLRESASAEHDARRAELALLHAAAAAEAAQRNDLAGNSYDEAAERDPQAFPALWARLRFAERSQDARLREAALRALAAREQKRERPGNASLDLADLLLVKRELSQAIAPLTAALSNDTTALAAASAAVLLPRSPEASELRTEALSYLAEHTSHGARRALELERLAELSQLAPDAARTVLTAFASREAAEPLHAVLGWLLCRDPSERAASFERLAQLTAAGDAVDQCAEIGLHVQRIRSIRAETNEADALFGALDAFAQAPGTLASALALDEALSDSDDPETRVTALYALLDHAQPTAMFSLRCALARALLDAGQAARAAALAGELAGELKGDLGALDTLRIAAREVGDFDAVVLACDRLAEHVGSETKARLLEEAAAVLHEQLRRPEEAETRLRRALEALPARKPAFDRLHDVLIERRDLDGLLAVLGTRIAISDDAIERIDLMYERARILRARNDRDGALRDARELLALSPTHPGALGLCAEIHASREDFPQAVAALQALARAELAPGQKRLAREGAADFLDHKLRDPRAAYLELAELAQTELADLSLYTRLADLAQRAGMLAEAARALTHAAARSGGAVRAAFERRAAILQLDALGDPAAGRESLRRALLAHPTDVEAFEILHTHSPSEERPSLIASFVETLWAAIEREPAQPDQLRALSQVGRTTGQGVLTLLGLSALSALGLANPREHEATEALHKRLPSYPRATLDDQTLALLEPALSDATKRFARAASEVWLIANTDAPERHGVERRDRLSKRSNYAARDALRGWLRAFGVDLAEVYVSNSEPTALFPVPAAGLKHSWILGRELGPQFSASARARLALPAAAIHVGVLPLVLVDNASARELLQTALSLVRPELAPRDGRARAAAEQLERKLPRALRRELTEASAALENPSETITACVDGVRTLALRAAAVAAGDLAPALRAVFGDVAPRDALLETKPGTDLLRFWLSPRCVALLEALGMTP